MDTKLKGIKMNIKKLHFTKRKLYSYFKRTYPPYTVETFISFTNYRYYWQPGCTEHRDCFS